MLKCLNASCTHATFDTTETTSYTTTEKLHEYHTMFEERESSANLSKEEHLLRVKIPSFVYLDSDNLAIIPRSKVRCPRKKPQDEEKLPGHWDYNKERENHTRANAYFPFTSSLSLEERPSPKGCVN